MSADVRSNDVQGFIRRDLHVDGDTSCGCSSSMILKFLNRAYCNDYTSCIILWISYRAWPTKREEEAKVAARRLLTSLNTARYFNILNLVCTYVDSKNRFSQLMIIVEILTQRLQYSVVLLFIWNP